MILETLFLINMRVLCFFLLCFSTVSAADFGELQENFRQGNYRSLLDEYDFLAKTWLEEGRFDDFMGSWYRSGQEASQKIHAESQIKKHFAKELDKIESEKNEALQFLVDRYPDFAMTQMLRDILHYHRLRAQYSDAVDFFRQLEFGAVDMPGDPIANQLQQILLNFRLRSLVVSSQVIDCRINNETGYFHKTVIELERYRVLKEFCEAHPESPAASFCLQALEVNRAMLPVALNQQDLSDLLVGIRAPTNILEDQARRILQDAYVKKLSLSH